jgi:predicted  nucleic acid-binding Zn-ribbon protein
MEINMENEILKDLLRVTEENGALKKEIEYLKEKVKSQQSEINRYELHNFDFDKIQDAFK